MDFSKPVEVFDRNSVTFVSVTESFKTTASINWLTPNILLSFAQFERKVMVPRSRAGLRGRFDTRPEELQQDEKV